MTLRIMKLSLVTQYNGTECTVLSKSKHHNDTKYNDTRNTTQHYVTYIMALRINAIHYN
jgi:hypothetical protein